MKLTARRSFRLGVRPVHSPRRLIATLAVAFVWVPLAWVPPVAAAGSAEEAEPRQATYRNPVGSPAADVFPDPSVIRGRDGYWYAYSTSGPRYRGDTGHKMKILRSADLVHWAYVGDVFTAETEPTYDGYGPTAQRLYWAPAIDYFDGRYFLYYSYVVNFGSDKHFRVIAVATAPTPAGPWTDSGQPVVETERWEPFPGETDWTSTIDPEVVAAPDGTRYLYWGSVRGGVRAARLSPDGLSVTGERVQLTPAQRYEASYVVHRDGWYYLMLSAIGGCCAGPVSAYPVMVGRSRHPLGPFVDRDGIRLDAPGAGGTPVVAPNGNRWISTGHNAVATDLSGQDWIVVHGIDRFDPYLNGGFGGANKRGLHIARLDWIDGWPTVRAGRGLPDGDVPAPDNDAKLRDAFEDEAGSAAIWGVEALRGWRIEQESAGGFLRTAQPEPGRHLLSPMPVSGDLRLRAAVRLPDAAAPAGLQIRGPGQAAATRAVIDPAERTLAIQVTDAEGDSHFDQVPLPATFDYADWHELAVTVRGTRVVAEVSHAGLGDPLARVESTTAAPVAGARVGVVADGAADFDDITVASLAVPVTERVPDPTVGAPIKGWSEEFDGTLSSAWQWVRQPVGTVQDGALHFPVQPDSLIDQRSPGNDEASLLLRAAPKGNWTVETTVQVPYRDGYPGAFPQAGLIAYLDDDNWVLLSDAARSGSRWIGFGKEMTYGPNVRYGDARLPGPSDSLWLRLKHTVDPTTGEHRYRASASRDGVHWVWYGTRVLPAGPQPRIGLAAFGAAEPLVATFGYVRFYH